MDLPETFTAESPAAPDILAALISTTPLPADYLAFLSHSDGGCGPMRVQPFFILLHPAATVAKLSRDRMFHDDFPGLLVVGGNGAGEAIAFDTNSPDLPLVCFDMTNIDLAESIQPLAPSFTALLALLGEDDRTAKR